MRAAVVCGRRERALSGCERSASRQSRAGQKGRRTATGMRTSSSRHPKNWKPSPVSDFARRLYMLMNLGQRDEPRKVEQSIVFKRFYSAPSEDYLPYPVLTPRSANSRSSCSAPSCRSPICPSIFDSSGEPPDLEWSRLGGQPLNQPEMAGADGWNSGMAEPALPHD
jgi:hypothetical protein